MAKPLMQARQIAGMSQSEMAEKLGISVPTLIKFENNPETARLGTILRLYDIVPAQGKVLVEKCVEDFFAG